jgi:ACT domain-containing protein
VARVATNTKAHTFLFIVDDILPTVMQVTLESSDPPLDAHSQRSHKTY